MGVCSIRLDIEKRVMVITGTGEVAIEDATKCLDNYIDSVKGLSAEDFSLVVDVTDLKLSPTEVDDVILAIHRLYHAIPFKHRFITNERLGGKQLEDDFVIVNDLEEAYRMAK